MNCVRVQWKISQADAANQPWPVEIEAHVRECADCRQFAEATRRLRPLPSVPPPVGLHTGIMARVRASGPAGEVGRGMRWAVAGAVVLLVAAALGGARRWRQEREPASEPVASAPATASAERWAGEVETVLATPYAAEWQRLQRDVESVGAFLRERLTAWPLPEGQPSL